MSAPKDNDAPAAAAAAVPTAAAPSAPATDPPTDPPAPANDNDNKANDANATTTSSSVDNLKKSAMAKFNMAKDAAKKYSKQAKDAADDRLSMQGQLKQARISLENFLSPDLEIEQQIPVALLTGAKGIVFLSSIKGGFGLGGSIGTGVIITRLDYGEGWSGPCSIGSLGAQVGFSMGVQKTDYIIILRDANAVQTFSSKGQIKFGADASIAAGPLGRNAALALSVNDKGYAATVSYSQAKGLYVGVSLDGQGIVVRNDCNEKYYGKKVTVDAIFKGTADTIDNDDYSKIVSILTEYTSDKGTDKDDLDNTADNNDNKVPL